MLISKNPISGRLLSLRSGLKKLPFLGCRAALLLAVASALPHALTAQSVSSVRINEVLPHNVSNYEDNYGVRHAWIELYNSSAGTVNVGGCYLTNDPADLKKYPIPKGDIGTIIKPYQQILFWADSIPLRGTFHTNFLLKPGEDNFVALVSNDGTTIIDSLTVPASVPADYSFARVTDGKGLPGDAAAWHATQHTTPGANNLVLNSNQNIDRLKTHDSVGIIMTITAMLVVFFGLALLYLCYRLIGIAAVKISGHKSRKDAIVKGKTERPQEAMGLISGDVAAAIGLALHQMQEESHDAEWGVITIRRMERRFSTSWNSRLRTLRHFNDSWRKNG